MYGKIQIVTTVTRRFPLSMLRVCGYMPQILAFRSSLVTLKSSIHNFLKPECYFKLKIFDAEFPCKRCFEPLYQNGGRKYMYLKTILVFFSLCQVKLV